MPSLLAGVTVLDISEYIAGPYCAALLADLGARVIKVEPPDGAEERRLGNRNRYRGNTRMALAFNHGKESLVLDLRRDRGPRDPLHAAPQSRRGHPELPAGRRGEAGNRLLRAQREKSRTISDEVYAEQKAVMRRIEACLIEHPSSYWVERLEAAGVPCGVVNYRPHLYDDPQVGALDMMWHLDNAELGPYKTVGHPIRFSRTPVKPGRGAPTLGQDSAAVLGDFGCSAEAIRRYKEAGVVKLRRPPPC